MKMTRWDHATEEERFWAKVDKTSSLTGCWLWTATKHGCGYGHFRTSEGKDMKAHRLAWQLLKGKIPKGMCLCHSCDNPTCVNPAHLFIGTHADNTLDAYTKHRLHDWKDLHRSGENHSTAKLTDAQALAIQQKYIPSKLHRAKKGLHMPNCLEDLALEYGVTNPVISRIVLHKRKSVDGSFI